MIYNCKRNATLLMKHRNIVLVLVFQVLAGAEGKAS